MKTLWNPELKPQAFERTDKIYARIPMEEMEDRGFLTEDIKRISSKLPDGVWLAGSWFESIYRNTTPKDLDIFFRDADAVQDFLELFTPKTEPPDDLGDNNGEPALSDKYTLPDHDLLESLFNDDETTAISIKGQNAPIIQMIRTRFYDSPDAVIDSFDFTACQFALGNEGVTYNPGGMLDVVRKRLVIHKITFPSSTMRRLIKYTKKGYYACGGSFIEMVRMFRDTPREDEDVLYID